MLNEQLVSEIFKLRDRINEMHRNAIQSMAKLAKSGIDIHSPEAMNAAKRAWKLEELRRKVKELALQTMRFLPKDSTE